MAHNNQKNTIWKVHPEYPNYAASPDGQIKNVKTGKILKPCFNSSEKGKGYLYVTLVDRFGMPKNEYVHRFVFECFYGLIPYKHEIHHADRDRCDNALNNLVCLSKIEHAQLHAAQRKGYENS